MTARIRDFLRNRNDDGPCLVVDLDVVRDNYQTFAKALPDTRVFYAVKANPAPEVLSLLASLGSCFDTASVAEIEMVLAAGATADRICYGNTIKKERDIARAYALGIRLFAVDCQAEVEKIARAAPGSRVFCRILSDCVGAEWPLSRKFGCEPAMAVDVLEHALKLGLEPYGVSFHVGSQQRNQHAWDRALASAAAVFRECGERGMNLSMVNLGGGFPTKYLKNVPTVKTYGTAIFKALRKHFGNRIPETIIEPGRGMVGNAGVIEAEVVLVSKKSAEDDVRWVYLDIGKFGGLAETMDESIRYPIRTPRDGAEMAPCVLAGPTCDSADVLYEKEPYMLPVSLEIGDKVLIEGTGAYTATYSSVAFNGFSPLEDGPHLTDPIRREPAGSRAAAFPNSFRTPSRCAVERGKELAMVTIRKELVEGYRARARRCSICAIGEARFAKASERLREGRLPADGLSFVGGRGRPPRRHRAPLARDRGPGRPALLLGPLAVASGVARDRGIGAALMRRALARRSAGSAIAPCCWSAMRLTTAASASRPRRPARCGCPARMSSTGCSALELVPGALDGARGLISADRHARADPGACDACIARPASQRGCRARSLSLMRNAMDAVPSGAASSSVWMTRRI